jgi:hypothetical protein
MYDLMLATARMVAAARQPVPFEEQPKTIPCKDWLKTVPFKDPAQPVRFQERGFFAARDIHSGCECGRQQTVA